MNKPQLLPTLAVLALSSGAFGQAPAKASSTLTLSLRMLDFEGSRQMGAMYMPSAGDLSEQKRREAELERQGQNLRAINRAAQTIASALTAEDVDKSEQKIVTALKTALAVQFREGGSQ